MVAATSSATITPITNVRTFHSIPTPGIQCPVPHPHPPTPRTQASDWRSKLKCYAFGVVGKNSCSMFVRTDTSSYSHGHASSLSIRSSMLMRKMTVGANIQKMHFKWHLIRRLNDNKEYLLQWPWYCCCLKNVYASAVARCSRRRRRRLFSFLNCPENAGKKFESQRKIHHELAGERTNEWTRDERVSEWVNEWMCDDLLIQLVRDRQACALALCISFADIGEGALTSAMRRHLKFHKFINFLHGCRIIACYWKYFNEFRVFFVHLTYRKSWNMP